MTGDCVLIAASDEEVLTLAEARSQCEVDDTVRDYDLVGWLKEGREDFEAETDRAVLTSTWEYALPSWPKCNGEIRLPKGRLQSVESLKWFTSDDSEQTISASDYYVDPGSELGLGRIVLKYGKYWPTSTLRTNRAIVVRFVAGWATRADVPDQIKSYVRLFTAHRFAHREAVLIGNRSAVDSNEMAIGLKRISSRLKIWHY